MAKEFALTTTCFIRLILAQQHSSKPHKVSRNYKKKFEIPSPAGHKFCYIRSVLMSDSSTLQAPEQKRYKETQSSDGPCSHAAPCEQDSFTRVIWSNIPVLVRPSLQQMQKRHPCLHETMFGSNLCWPRVQQSSGLYTFTPNHKDELTRVNARGPAGHCIWKTAIARIYCLCKLCRSWCMEIFCLPFADK